MFNLDGRLLLVDLFEFRLDASEIEALDKTIIVTILNLYLPVLSAYIHANRLDPDQT